MGFKPWPKIKNIRDAEPGDLAGRNAVAKVKLHGTNAAVRFEDGTYYCQSRNRDITPENDNYGFAAFIESLLPKDRDYSELDGKVFYGEWCGPGICKGTAISELPERMWFIFAVSVGDVVPYINEGDYKNECSRFLDLLASERVAWLSYGKTEGFLAEYLCRDLPYVAQNLRELEESGCPVAAQFGIKGQAEGLVYYLSDGSMYKAKLASFWEAIKTKNTPDIALVSPDSGKVSEFLNEMLTPERLQQGVDQACEGKIKTKLTGQFLKWVCQDCEIEGADLMRSLGLDWKAVRGDVVKVARAWWFKEME